MRQHIKDTTLVNDKRYKMQIFQSLMAMKVQMNEEYSVWDLEKELKKLENEGKLRIYHE